MKRLKRFLRHLFLPHHSNNHRARILHHEFMLALVAILVVGSVLVGTIQKTHPDVLGVSVNMSIDDLLLLTNAQRQQNNLPALQLNGQLNAAAAGKAANMFAENYWAHNSPSGKTPWDFIHGAGYNYVYAGENLARGFSTAQDTVNAWMASPGHRANVLSSNYSDVGFAIAQGSLTGDPNTVLVVEEFGSQSFARPSTSAPVVATQQNPAPTAVVVTPTPFPTAIPTPTPSPAFSPEVLATAGFEPRSRIQQAPLINTAFWARTTMLTLLGIFILTFFFDIVIVGRRKIVRIVGHNADHIFFLLAILWIAYLVGQGVLY